MGTLRTLVYASTARPWVDEAALKDMLKQARLYNQLHALTGVLLYEDGNFLQTIEGPEGEIDAVFYRICASARHYDIQLILDAPIEKRSFPNWSMGFIDMPKDKYLRQSANQWRLQNAWPRQADRHIGAQMIDNYWKRYQTIVL
jgi:hypothetical protein